MGFQKGGVYRIVQVPLNYPFTHLRALIAWLFDTPAKCTHSKALEEEYLFEVKTKIAMESTLMKPGMIKSGVTSVKVSNAKDPWRKRYGRDLDDEDELSSESELDEDEFTGSLEDESDDLIWADEEEYTIGHVWNTGVQADRGIIYVSCFYFHTIYQLFNILQHHSPGTQIHIAVNCTKLPHRRGKSNVPYVFFARGRIHLSPRPLPRPAFSRSILHTLSSSPTGPSTPTKRKKEFRPSCLPPKCKGNFSSSNEVEADLSDTDADGGVDSDQDEDFAVKLFDKNHPYFGCQQSMVRKPKRNRIHNVVVRADAKKRILKSSETIYVEDSDEENRRKLAGEDKDDDEWMEVYDRLINPDQWNGSHYAFGRYFLSFIDRKGRSYAHVDDEFFEDKKPYDPFDDDNDSESQEDEYVEEDSMRYSIEVESDAEDSVEGSSTPDLTTSYHTSSSLPPSSPPAQISSSSPAWHLHLSSEDTSFALPASIDPLSLSPGSSLELHPMIVASHYPNKKYTATPAPPKARKHRLQLERLERRLEKVKKGKYLCACDEDIEDNNKEEEVDELFDDDDDDDCVGNKEMEKIKKWVKPSLKEWDPFGDEVEV